MSFDDEIDFDLPALGKDNLWRIERLKNLMEMSGGDIGIPLTVSASFHPLNWAEEVKL